MGSTEKMIRKFYNILIEIENEQNKIKPTVIKWMRDLGETI